jgi:hypothetical protein
MSHLSKALYLFRRRHELRLAFIRGFIVGVGTMLLIFILIYGDL